MSVKEIRELEDAVREVEGPREEVAADSREAVEEQGWEERDFVEESSEEDLEGEDSEEKEKGFSIGDTMLGRGERREVWREESLEEWAWEDEDEDLGDEDLGDEGFSYEEMGRGDDLYGAGSQDLYGAGAGGDLYGVAGVGGAYGASGVSGGYGAVGQGSGSGGYDVGGVGKTGYDVAQGGQGGGYDAGKKKGKKAQGVYAVGSSVSKEGRRGKKSGLIGALGGKRKGKGVSIY